MQGDVLVLGKVGAHHCPVEEARRLQHRGCYSCILCQASCLAAFLTGFVAQVVCRHTARCTLLCCFAPVLPGLASQALQAGVQQLQTAGCFAWQRPARWLVVGNSCDA